MKWLTNLLENWSCKHKWKEMHRMKWMDSKHDLPVKTTVHYLCPECGKFKKIDL